MSMCMIIHWLVLKLMVTDSILGMYFLNTKNYNKNKIELIHL